MNAQVEPIQRQMWAMVKLFLNKSPKNIVIINTIYKSTTINHKVTLANFNTFIGSTNKFKSGIIKFCCGVHYRKFEFIYSFEPDCVAYTPHQIPPNARTDALELFCEAEFLLNIELYDVENNGLTR